MSEHPEGELFSGQEVSSTRPETAAGAGRAPVRLRRPERDQAFLATSRLDDLLEAHHPARAFWAAVGRLDTSKFEEPIEAREGEVGRDATDPKVLLAVWLYAFSEGIGSAREVSRRCTSDDVFRWICGGLTPDRTLLCEFKTKHLVALKELFVQLGAVLLHQGLIDLHRVALDGTRIRAAAGQASFRRERTLKNCLAKARGHLEEIVAQAREDEVRNARAGAAQQRGARERVERLEAALAEMQTLQSKPVRDPERPPRVSTTDPEARVMKMPDGGFRPAHNAQFATETTNGLIVGVRVTNSGSDGEQLVPMAKEIEANFGGEKPQQVLADGGYHSHAQIDGAAEMGVEVFMPANQRRWGKERALEVQQTDSPAVADYKRRMQTPEAKELYRERAATAELTNALIKGRQGLNQVLVRGSKKVLGLLFLHALTHNILRWWALGGLT